MTWDLLADPIFRLPFLAGLLLAGVLPVLGVLLMLRDEWLAALGLAHLAAAGALLGIALGIPALFGAGLGACAGGMAKSLTGIRGNGAYAFMILIGWSGLMLVAANSPGGEALGHALIEGQLYFAGWSELIAALLLVLAAAMALPGLMPKLLHARFFPRHERANRLPAWRWHLGFDLLVAPSPKRQPGLRKGPLATSYFYILPSHFMRPAPHAHPLNSASPMANGNPEKNKSLESWIWDAACSIRGAKDAPKYKDYILPLIFTKRLCDVFDDELNRIAEEVGSRKKAFQLAKADHKLVRFYLPLVPADPEQPVWSVIRKLSDKIGEGVTTHMRAIARENPLLQGIIDRVDFNATTHGQRDLDDDRLSNLIEAISTKRLGLEDVEGDIIGKSYEYLIRKFAEGSGQSAGEFYSPGEVGRSWLACSIPSPAWRPTIPPAAPCGLLIKCWSLP
jgi:hypothetical protein